MNNEPSSMSLCDKPKSAKDKAIKYFKDNRDLFCANVKDNNVISKAIDIAISEATHDCKETKNGIVENTCPILKEYMELKEKINALKKETFLDDDSIQRAEKYKKDFPLRRFDWEYIHELEFLLDYRVDFGQKLLEDRQKLQKENTELKEQLRIANLRYHILMDKTNEIKIQKGRKIRQKQKNEAKENERS